MTTLQTRLAQADKPTKGPEMTPDNPDPLEVWEEAYGAFVFADDSAQYQAAAAIIAQHYAPVIAENERLEALVGELGEALRPYLAVLAEKPQKANWTDRYCDARDQLESVARPALAKLEKARG